MPITGRIQRNIHQDGIDRRGFLECMAWAGTGVRWTVTGGVLAGQQTGRHIRNAGGGLAFAQLSDSHIGFRQEANPDATATLQAAVDRINALPTQPAFVIHTGDISHLSKVEEFDAAEQILKGLRARQVFYVPGEHDVLTTHGRMYLERFGKGTQGSGWYSFDQSGIHFIALVNVVSLTAGGQGSLGQEQLEWMARDLQDISDSTPIVVFAHMPLWSIYPEWGWGTADGAQALGYLRRFGSVTVLNGHIHQVLQKVEGHIAFHTAASTAFPQPRPGAAPSPGPVRAPAEQLRAMLGITSVRYQPGNSALAIIDTTLEKESASAKIQVEPHSFSWQSRMTGEVIVEEI
jgi:3',5'-cyclic AMP phosphodiesterase CpdA